MSEKKNIYNLNLREMRKLILQFGGTLYGRTVFFLAYFLSFMAFLALSGLVIASFLVTENLFYPVLGTFFIFVALFILGNIYYYHEIRHFSESRQSK